MIQPSFAAQIRTRDGRVLHFDDPGCLLLAVDGGDLDPAAVYFHHRREERWIERREVGFVPVPTSPMGYGLAAVDRASPGALSPAQALDRARARETARRSD